MALRRRRILGNVKVKSVSCCALLILQLEYKLYSLLRAHAFRSSKIIPFFNVEQQWSRSYCEGASVDSFLQVSFFVSRLR